MTLRPLLFLLVLAVAPVCADVTQKFALRLEPGEGLPPSLVEPVAKELLGDKSALSFEIRLKGSRASTRMGSFFSISDFDGAMVTVLDSAGQRYATAGADEYIRIHNSVRKAAEKPSTSTPRAPVDLRITMPVHATGKVRTIHGVETAEQELSLTAPVSPTATLGVRVSLWCPTEKERLRNPAILELQRYSDRAYVPANMAGELAKSIGAGESKEIVADLMKTLMALGMCLETRVTYMSPDGDAMMHLVQEMTEFSSAPIPNSAFEVPRTYSVVRMEELLAQPSQNAPVKAQPTVGDPEADADRPRLRRR